MLLLFILLIIELMLLAKAKAEKENVCNMIHSYIQQQENINNNYKTRIKKLGR